jgi:hypothetical protein
MTVSSTNTKNSYSGNGSTTVFAYTFKIFDDDDITVILRTDATGAETVQTKTTDYTVSGVGNAGGGNITFGTAPASGITVVLLRETAQTQATDYTPNDPFPAASHEDALDKLTLIIQDQQEELDRAIKVSRTNTITSSEFTVGASTRANKIFAFDSSGDLAVTQEIGTYQGTDATTTTSAYAERDIVKSTTAAQLNNVYICIQASPAGTLLTNTSYWQLLVDAVTAATSATNAAASATAAAASETAAAASESAAATSESNAATSESNASTSATNAATSATASAASASAASTSETNAATSATNASTSATAAASSATAAASSATAAAASESAAATSETNAATSASNAATSETNAATSESNAATSASNAATSATNAATAQTAAEAARDAIQQFYLGAQSSNPTVDGNGDPVTAGDWYFNTSDNTTRIYDGSSWNTVSPDLVGDTTPQLGGDLDTNGNDINFGDNDKAIFGASSDLSIFHDGSNSYIQEDGTGNLRIRATDLTLEKNAGGEYYLQATADGAVRLYYDGNQKLVTTATGIDVTGTITSDGLTVDGDVEISSPSPEIYLMESDTSDVNTRVRTSAGAFRVETINDAKNSIVLRQRINHATGDISFYSSDGLSQGFFWDASTQRLGLGITAPDTNLQVNQTGTAGNNYDLGSIKIGDTVGLEFGFNNIGSGRGSITSLNNSGTTNNRISFGFGAITSGGEPTTNVMTLNQSGKVGIGTSSPTGKLDVEDTTGSLGATNDVTAEFYRNDGTYGPRLQVRHSTSGTDLHHTYSSSASNFTFSNGGTERMRIDSSGNLLVGKTSLSASTDGVEARADGELNSSKTSNIAFSVNRNGTDGDIAVFKKSGTIVGSIGVESNQLYAVTGDTGLKFAAGVDAVVPVNANGANRDNAINLGVSSVRFKDLYLSGGVYLGGTGSDNLLDDYEIGTWDVSLRDDTGVVDTHTISGRYVKSGDMVFATAAIFGGSGFTASGDVKINLPFAAGVTQVNVSSPTTYIADAAGIEAVYIIDGAAHCNFSTDITDGNKVTNKVTTGAVFGSTTKRLYFGIIYSTA